MDGAASAADGIIGERRGPSPVLLAGRSVHRSGGGVTSLGVESLGQVGAEAVRGEGKIATAN